MEKLLIDSEFPEVEREFECYKCDQSVYVIVKIKFFSGFADRFPKFCPLCGYLNK